MIDSDGNETKTIYEAVLLEEVIGLREELAALKAVSLSGYIDNMQKIEYEANISGEAGMLMMASFAVKTANAYLKR
mgnify:CR=1 FL=1